ncbi:acyl-CoA thioesterase-1 [Limimonas halophila]|uniref:Acyl-CoA thioesterase-1 n=1 Tax=Limimonas halophila TaxID=1082479 RepID=A0A1G7RHB7_9PROT|nr:arylesterase [Limimonas halophila]SDG10226.1 acyl-CoA thioesterase-1 [Limimonas halophila]
MRRPLAVLAAALALLAAAPAAAEPLRLLAFGDSLVHGYGLAEGKTFPDQLEAALREAGHAVRVTNAGSSGDTTEAGRSRLDWVVRPRTDAVIVVLGANDALRGIDPAVTRRNLDAILGRLTEQDLPTLLAGMKAPRNLGENYVARFDAIYPELAEKHGAVFYPFFLKGVAQKPALNQDDGIHPNAEGVRVIVENMLPKVKKLLARARDASGS